MDELKAVQVVRPTTIELAERVAAYFQSRPMDDDNDEAMWFAATSLPGCIATLEKERDELKRRTQVLSAALYDMAQDWSLTTSPLRLTKSQIQSHVDRYVEAARVKSAKEAKNAG